MQESFVFRSTFLIVADLRNAFCFQVDHINDLQKTEFPVRFRLVSQ